MGFVMRRVSLGVFAMLAILLGSESAEAGAWCLMEMSGSGDGATNCGFKTREQCLMTGGGFCTLNQWPENERAVTTPYRRKQLEKRQRL